MTRHLPSPPSVTPAQRARPRAARVAFAGLAAALGLAGCGSSGALPPAAVPPASPPLVTRPSGQVEPVTRATGAGREPVVLAGGTRIAVLRPRRRTLEVYDAATRRRLASIPAGIGPARLASDGGNLLFVTDPVGQAVLVFHLHPRFELIRRVVRHGGPWAIAFDRDRGSLWITLPETNQVAEYASGARPVPRGIHPSVRAPLAVAVLPGGVRVSGRAQTQVLEEPRTR